MPTQRYVIAFLAALSMAAGFGATASRGEIGGAARAAETPASPVLDESAALVRDFALAITGSLDSANTDSIVVYRVSGADTAAFGLRPLASKTFSRTITLLEGNNEVWAIALDASGSASPRSNTLEVLYETIIARIHPEVFRAPDVFEIDLAELAYEATVDLYTVGGEHVVQLRKTGAATQFRIDWNLESGDGLPVRNGVYLAVFTVTQSRDATTIEKRFIAVVR